MSVRREISWVSMFFVKHKVENVSHIADLVSSEQSSEQQIQGLFHECVHATVAQRLIPPIASMRSQTLKRPKASMCGKQRRLFMVPISKIVGAMACGFVLCVGLSYADAAHPQAEKDMSNDRGSQGNHDTIKESPVRLREKVPKVAGRTGRTR
jgi:hypothetical protein